MPRSIAIVIHPGFQMLDAAGPVAAFEIAERFAPGSYDIRVMAPGGGEIVSSAGLKLRASPLGEADLDTAVLSGGALSRSPEAMASIIAWLKRLAARRIASVCSGAYLLAEAGLLDDRGATTHWERSSDFAHRYPKVKLDPERILRQ